MAYTCMQCNLPYEVSFVSDMRNLHYMININEHIFYLRIFVTDKFHRYISLNSEILCDFYFTIFLLASGIL